VLDCIEVGGEKQIFATGRGFADWSEQRVQIGRHGTELSECICEIA
jgi:hypothetical protein